MRRVTAIDAAAATFEGRARSVSAPEPGALPAPATGTALVAVTPALPAERAWRPSRRPVAAFIAQLIATSRSAPQTRLRRRAEPAEAIAVYAAANAVATAGRPTVARSL